MKIKYIQKRFSRQSKNIIEQAEKIIGEYAGQDLTLTLRQLYYQFVARALLANTERSYKNLGNIITDARRAGLIDWDAIEDRTRYLRRQSFWNSPQHIFEQAQKSYHRDLWADQDFRLEVWIEKDALLGVIESVCDQYDVPYFSCRGYVSDSEMWAASMRIIGRNKQDNQALYFLHLGDHDPSGLDMTRDIKDRLHGFADIYSESFWRLKRIALNMDQIRELKPPPNPAKITDSRYQNYVKEYGHESWELDALDPKYIQNLVENEIKEEIDAGQWHKSVRRQERERRQIGKMIKNMSEKR